MDSLITYRLFYPHATAVFVETGSRYMAHDLHHAQTQEPYLHILRSPLLVERDDGVVPHRNALLLALVANRLDAEEIVVSAPRGELIWDQQPAFHRAMERVLPGVRIMNPLKRMTKSQAVAAWLDAGFSPRTLVDNSRSCYSNNAHQCGQCPACVKRWVALTNNGLQEFYHADVREHAIKLGNMATLRHLFSYGLRPAWEAWRAVNAP